MEQVLYRLQAHDDAELVPKDASVIVAIEGGPTFLGRGSGLDALNEANHPRPIEAERSPRAGLLLEGGGPMPVVPGGPLLNGSLSTGEGDSDLSGRSSLDGQYHGLMSLPQLDLVDGVGEGLESFDGQMILDLQSRSPPDESRQPA